MIYFDSTYVARVYLIEHGATEVRALFAAQASIACCELGKAEVASVFHRKLREGAISHADHAERADQFAEDSERGVWHWLPVTSGLLDRTRREFAALSPAVFLRAADAIHLVCARDAGFAEVHTNDRHMLAAAPHFGLTGINVIPARAS